MICPSRSLGTAHIACNRTGVERLQGRKLAAGKFFKERGTRPEKAATSLEPHRVYVDFWYDDASAFFVDPLGFDAGDTNLYRYVNNRATGATDPSGLGVWEWLFGNGNSQNKFVDGLRRDPKAAPSVFEEQSSWPKKSLPVYEPPQLSPNPGEIQKQAQIDLDYRFRYSPPPTIIRELTIADVELNRKIQMQRLAKEFHEGVLGAAGCVSAATFIGNSNKKLDRRQGPNRDGTTVDEAMSPDLFFSRILSEMQLRHTGYQPSTLTGGKLSAAPPPPMVSETVPYYRVQGGISLSGARGSQQHIRVDGAGNVTIRNATLNVSAVTPAHANYFQQLRPGSTVIEFRVPRWLHEFIGQEAIPQTDYWKNPLNRVQFRFAQGFSGINEAA